MKIFFQHILIYPIITPLLAGAILLLLSETKRYARSLISILSIMMQLITAASLLYFSADCGNNICIYAIGGWPAPFGIFLVSDKLTIIMLILTSILGFCSFLYALGHWDRIGVHFYPLFQFLMMGLNGAFLTGDLFNLFVFFEVLLAASYGLMLHGSGSMRVSASLHYIVVNLVVSFLILIGIALIYGVTGTLNLADVAISAIELEEENRLFFNVGIAILGIAFIIKAGVWPLNFWLIKGYIAAVPPVTAMLSIMTKLSIYTVLRIKSLLIILHEIPIPFDLNWIFYIGLVTLIFGCIGLIASYQVEKISGYCIIISTGILFMSLGMPGINFIGPALFYLVNSVLASSTLFLLSELIKRTNIPISNCLTNQDVFEAEEVLTKTSSNRSDEIVGIPIPAAMAFLGLSFISCALLITGLPPLSGFVAKFALLSTAVSIDQVSYQIQSWILFASILFSGLAGLFSFTRIGIRIFWSKDTVIPFLRWVEVAPIGILIFLCIDLSINANLVLSYLNDAAKSLGNPFDYINTVLNF
ncbi:MAG: monovalent cation/H+ antiporter subunit D [Bordetella sp.]|nr:MAG: monovalent cation/H+ antiporter subunit D [Bordetella sp.]